MSVADRERWEPRWRARPEDPGPPEPWLVERLSELPRGPLLDVASGDGRNALWLAEQGFAVTAVDIAPTAIARLNTSAAARGLRIATRVADLDEPGALEGLEGFASLLVVRYKPSAQQWDRLIAVLRPEGRVFLCSFGRERAREGFDPAFCIAEDELRALLEPRLRCLRYERLGAAADWLEGSIWERRP
ncbi:MAG: methyltransferase domain-containing protein [Geminicoccaceae bacterium]|nr:methyltransferase domain-containing protein [Geminicoccaceae bacterium]MDW8341734.1 methyltransferase domain-containing protein [Geminicoccaceae bacterium]